MLKRDELLFQETYTFGQSPSFKKKLLIDSDDLREERGANTEPTGLGMERW